MRWVVSSILMLLTVVASCADAPLTLPDPVDSALAVGDLCEPHRWTCISQSEEALCGYDGSFWQATEVCHPDESCSEYAGSRCFKPICTPGVTRCSGNTQVQVCGDLGARWQDDFDCGSSYLCIEGRCTLASCLGHVLFVIDRSGSMAPHWSSVRNATQSVVAGNPVARFGLLGFPASDKLACSASGEPQVGLTTSNLVSKIDAFFSVPPTGGTPLVATLERLRSTAPKVFGPQGGALVILTDGNDTCAPSQLAHPSYLAQLAQDIDQLHNVKTYVIGYNFGGEAEQLEALAAGGGTIYTSFIPAGTEEELANVFTEIVSDWKLCF